MESARIIGIGFLLAFLVAMPMAAQGPTPIQGPVIDSIAVVREDIFAEADASGNMLFRAANALHVTTRRTVISRELLFRVGERWDPVAAAESARNLRRLGIFRDVTIDTVSVDGRLVVRVHTADGWSTSVDVGARSTGGQLTWSIGFFERNLLGTATLVGVGYRQDTDRTAWRVTGHVPRIGTSRASVRGVYDVLSDGHLAQWSVGVPYRAFQDRLAVTVEGEDADQRILRYRDALLFETYGRTATWNRLVVSWAPRRSSTGYLRLGIGAQVRQEGFTLALDSATPAPAVPDTVTGAIGAYVDWLHAQYRVVRYFNGFGRDEDLDLSTGMRAGFWVAPTLFGYAETGIGPVLEARTAASFGEHFVKFGARASALFTESGIDSARVVAQLTVGIRPLTRHSTALLVEAGQQEAPPPGDEFDLGHRRGPRAFRAHSFTGTTTIWGTLEHRWFLIDDAFHLLGVGIAAFADFGGAWYGDEPARHGGNVGMGLRLGPSRASGLNIGRFDLAWRWGDGVGTNRWVFSFGRAYTF